MKAIAMPVARAAATTRSPCPEQPSATTTGRPSARSLIARRTRWSAAVNESSDMIRSFRVGQVSRELSVPAAVEHQWRGGGIGAQRVHVQQHDAVIAAGHLGVQRAVQPQGRSVDEDTAGAGLRPVRAGEPVDVALRESRTDLVLA